MKGGETCAVDVPEDDALVVGSGEEEVAAVALLRQKLHLLQRTAAKLTAAKKRG